jgi:hypothetical protein
MRLGAWLALVIAVGSCSPVSAPAPSASPPLSVGRPAESGTARAHAWRYAQWGMSPEEVVGASDGRANLVPYKAWTAAEEQKFDAMARQYGLSPQLLKQFKGASSSFEDGGILFDVSFMFDNKTKGLVNVLVAKDACDQAEATRIKLGLTSIYGAPFEDYDFYGLMVTTKWRAKGELVEFSVTKEKDSELKSCMVSYEPIPKLSNNWLPFGKPQFS